MQTSALAFRPQSLTLSGCGSQPISRVLSAACAAVTVIPLDVRLPARSSHLPASSVGHVIACLFGVAPGGGCRVSPRSLPARSSMTVFTRKTATALLLRDFAALRRQNPAHETNGLVSVALFLASRRTVVSRHPTLWSPDFPLPAPLKAPTATVWPTPAAILTRRSFWLSSSLFFLVFRAAGT